jgi:hypothetical protein
MYLVCLLILFLVHVTIAALVALIGWSNAFGLRNAIARERGIAAHRAWVPFEKIRPTNISRERWEEAFGCVADVRCGRQSRARSLPPITRILGSLRDVGGVYRKLMATPLTAWTQNIKRRGRACPVASGCFFPGQRLASKPAGALRMSSAGGMRRDV